MQRRREVREFHGVPHYRCTGKCGLWRDFGSFPLVSKRTPKQCPRSSHCRHCVSEYERRRRKRRVAQKTALRNDNEKRYQLWRTKMNARGFLKPIPGRPVLVETHLPKLKTFKAPTRRIANDREQ